MSKEKNMSFSFLHYEKISPCWNCNMAPCVQSCVPDIPKTCKQNSVLIPGRAHWQYLSPSNSWGNEYCSSYKQNIGHVWILHFPLEYDLYFYWTTVSWPCSIANNTLKIEWQQLPQQRLTQKVKLHLCNTHFPGTETSLPLVFLYPFQHHNKNDTSPIPIGGTHHPYNSFFLLPPRVL